MLISIDAERLAQLRRTVRPDLGRLGGTASSDHFPSFQGQDGPDQDRCRETIRLGYKVQHPVHPIRKIDISMPGRPIHHLRAWRPSSAGMAAQVRLTMVSLRLEYYSPQALSVIQAHKVST